MTRRRERWSPGRGDVLTESGLQADSSAIHACDRGRMPAHSVCDGFRSDNVPSDVCRPPLLVGWSPSGVPPQGRMAQSQRLWVCSDTFTAWTSLRGLPPSLRPRSGGAFVRLRPPDVIVFDLGCNTRPQAIICSLRAWIVLGVAGTATMEKRHQVSGLHEATEAGRREVDRVHDVRQS